MALCTFSAFFKAYTPRLLFSVFCCAATLVFALACYLLLLSSASMANIAAFLPDLPSTSIIYSNCRSTMVGGGGGDNRGSQLFHSWPDAELFERALSAEAKLSSEGMGDGYSHQSPFSASSPTSQKQLSCLTRRTRRHLPYVNSKIAFLFLTRGPLPFAPLWNQFFHGHEHLYNIYVHLNPFRVGVFDRRTAGVFWGRLIPPDLTERGAPSLVAAERRLLANALLDDSLNHYFALISKRCIPLVSFHKVYDHVMASEKSFLEILTDAPTLYGRYEARGAGAVMLPEVPFESFRVGSQFFILTREHAVVVVLDERIWSNNILLLNCSRLPSSVDSTICQAYEEQCHGLGFQKTPCMQMPVPTPDLMLHQALSNFSCSHFQFLVAAENTMSISSWAQGLIQVSYGDVRCEACSASGGTCIYNKTADTFQECACGNSIYSDTDCHQIHHKNKHQDI